MTDSDRFVAEIVSIGDEIVFGSVVDTNSAFLSRELAALGIRTLYHTTVGDELPAMLDVFRQAVSRSDLVIVTGGLGPTEDDLTRQACAQLAGVELVHDEVSAVHIRHLFKIRNRPMPESNFIQAMFPQGATVLFNPNGTAPGFFLDIQRKRSDTNETAPSKKTGSKSKPKTVRMITFPGVPAEMKEMWALSGIAAASEAAAKKLGVRRHIQSRSIHCFGAGESDIESRLPHLIARDHSPKVGITASQGIITLRIAAEGDDHADCQKQIDETAAVIYEKVGDLVFGEGAQTLASVLTDQLIERGKKVAVIEWGTNGRLCQKIDRRVFVGGMVDTVSRPVRTLLGLDSDNPETVMRSFAEKTGADCILAVGPYPSEEELKTPEKAYVHVYALDHRSEGIVFVAESFTYGLHPSMIDDLFSDRAINLLRKLLIA